jgi:hypothetical protein
MTVAPAFVALSMRVGIASLQAAVVLSTDAIGLI